MKMEQVTERETGLPLRLLHGKRIIIEIESYTVIKISVVGWNEDIESGDTDMEWYIYTYKRELE